MNQKFHINHFVVFTPEYFANRKIKSPIMGVSINSTGEVPIIAINIKIDDFKGVIHSYDLTTNFISNRYVRNFTTDANLDLDPNTFRFEVVWGQKCEIVDTFQFIEKMSFMFNGNRIYTYKQGDDVCCIEMNNELNSSECKDGKVFII